MPITTKDERDPPWVKMDGPKRLRAVPSVVAASCGKARVPTEIIGRRCTLKSTRVSSHVGAKTLKHFARGISSSVQCASKGSLKPCRVWSLERRIGNWIGILIGK